MGVPPIYREAGDRVVASYDYYDFAEGVGVKTFYGADSKSLSGGAIYLLTTDGSVYSHQGWFGDSVTLNFDLAPFNEPKTIKGNAFISFSVIKDSAGGQGYWFAQVQKVASDGTITNCCTNTACEQLIAGVAHSVILTKLALTTTSFAVGDYLRLVIQQDFQAGGTGQTGCDPVGRDSSALTSALTNPVVTTKMRLYMPFLIEN